MRYEPTRPHADRKLVGRLHKLSRKHSRLGYRKITVKLRKEGRRVNKKRVSRSIKATDVIDIFEGLMTRYGPPEHVRSDSGPEFVAQAIQR